jgi:predicted O-linked N-acetylglucosamine transferase (SPINDLY family)
MAPVQISHVGYPGSLGASYIDYLVADPVVIPAEEQEITAKNHPPCRQLSAQRSTAGHRRDRTTRAGFGLPADDFVFCCFNHNYKIGPREFDVWMRLLTGTAAASCGCCARTIGPRRTCAARPRRAASIPPG